jgi:serine/threonine-protein kinase HipA
MPRPSSTRALSVWMNGERVGDWTTRANGPEEFRYAKEWLTSEGARPISLSMPLRPTAYKGEVVSAYFDNLLPDSKPIRQRLQRRFGVKSVRAFDLLGEVGRDCIGAIQLLNADAGIPDVRHIQCDAMTEAQIEQHLGHLLHVPMGQTDSEDFRISLAGAQEKSALLYWDGQWMRPRGATPTSHILKLPIGTGGAGIDLSTSVENEWLCARILREFGISTADCWMDQFGSQKVLVVKRFDRRVAADGKWIIRLPMEDLCQANAVAGDQKYES